MRDLVVFLKKVAGSVAIIEEAIAAHGHRVYMAYSGGKDSRVLRELVRSVTTNVLIVHNRHEGESVEEEFGMLVVEGPKTVWVEKFLETVELDAQMDSTRRDEDKLVRFDGEEIHRSRMPHYHTENGYFGLDVWFPLIEWTDRDVALFKGLRSRGVGVADMLALDLALEGVGHA